MYFHQTRNLDLIDFYMSAAKHVRNSGFEDEIEWQRTVSIETLSEEEFLSEVAWVILNSGFKESIIRPLFSKLSLCFCNWGSAQKIIESKDLCRETALSVFANRRKIDAIIQCCEIVSAEGFDVIKSQIEIDPLNTLKKFPYLGDITSIHVAKNIGLQLAKPDRHLVRLAKMFDFKCVQEMCSLVSEQIGDPINVVDIILWRHMAVMGKNYSHI